MSATAQAKTQEGECRCRMPKWFEKHAKFIKENGSENELAGFIENKQGLIAECERAGIPIETVKHYWHKSENYSIFAKNNFKTYESIRDEVVAEMKEYAPMYPNIKRDSKGDYAFIVNPADVHIGKYASLFNTSNQYNMNIAKERVQDGVIGLLQQVDHIDIEKIYFVIGNDILHTDTKNRTTTAGTPQDTDGMWFENYNVAKQLYIWCIETLIQKADVHVVFCPSNHDYQSGWFLADSIESWFHNSSNVSFDCTMHHRKYILYGRTLCGFSHGDGAKDHWLSDIMKKEAKKAWSMASQGHWFLNHLHHSIKKNKKRVLLKDVYDVTIHRTNDDEIQDEVFVHYSKSPSGTDTWHHEKGYTSMKAIEGHLIHAEECYKKTIFHYFK